MAIREKTRLARVDRWISLKKAWEAKLSRATTQNDTDVANKMIAEAEGILSRFESAIKMMTEDQSYERSKIEKITKKVKADRSKKDIETSNNAEEGTNIGL